jgi:putative Mg2+ transporter-C (MgtC) family protein
VHSIPALGWDGALIRLVAAAALGALIGLERELDEKSAGLRTHILVCVGSTLFTLVSAYGFHDFLVSGSAIVRTDPSRIAAQIVTGIGFLGAGVIFRQGASVRGLTTAASLWIVAAIGMACGAGFWPGAVIATVVALFSLRVLELVKRRALPTLTGRRMRVDLDADAQISEVIARLERFGQVDACRRLADRLEVEVEVPREARGDVLADAAGLAGVREVRWTG